MVQLSPSLFGLSQSQQKDEDTNDLFNVCYFYRRFLVLICLALVFREVDYFPPACFLLFLAFAHLGSWLPFRGRVTREWGGRIRGPGSASRGSGFAPGPPHWPRPTPPDCTAQDYTSQAPLRGEPARSSQPRVGMRSLRRTAERNGRVGQAAGRCARGAAGHLGRAVRWR